MSTRKPMRYAHSEGHTALAFENSGRYLLTCGSDGDVRIWDGLEDDDPESKPVGGVIYAIAIHATKYYVASEENSILAYSFPSSVSEGLVARFSAPVSHMCLSETGNELLAGSCDFTIKYVQLADSDFKVLLGHEAPILSVALDSKLQYGASSSCDGTVRVWNLAKQTCVKSWGSVFTSSNDFSLSKVLCRMAWEPPSGNYLAIPMGKNVKFFKRDSWEESYVLKDDRIEADINVISFMRCGRYLAAACLDGAIFVWSVDSRKCIERLKHEKGLTICSLEWNPNGSGDIAFCDVQGKLGGFEGVLREKRGPTHSSPKKNEHPPLELQDEDDENSFSISKIKAETVGVDSFFDDDDDVRDARAETEKPPADQEAGLERHVVSREPLVTLPKLSAMQPPFQPGSTPSHYQHRFMMWNSVGIVRSYVTEEENSIDIEFHDSAVHHSMHLENFLNHTMADVSTTAVVLGCQAQPDVPSKLVCLHFGSWDNCKEWTVDMPEGENVEAISVSQDWVAAATSRRQLRVFTVGSVQRDIFCLPGPVVAMASFLDQIIVGYHHALGLPGDQCLSLMLVERQAVRQHTLPLSPGSTLAWLGFTDEGTPCSADSAGVIRMLSPSLGDGWIEIADTRKHVKGKSDHYFIVGLSESQQQIRCIPCKGSSYPQTLPPPTVVVLPFQIPVCEMSCEKGQLEEAYLRQSLLLDTLQRLEELGFDTDGTDARQTKTQQKESLMKLFALACRSGREFRALELSHMMDTYHTVQLAIKYASQLRRMQLAQKLGEVAYQKMETELRDEEADADAEPSVRGASVAAIPANKFGRRQSETDRDSWSRQQHESDGRRQKNDGSRQNENRQQNEHDDQPQNESDEDCSDVEASLPESQDCGQADDSRGRHNPFRASLSRSESKGIQAFDDMKLNQKVKETNDTRTETLKPKVVKPRTKKTGDEKMLPGKSSDAKRTSTSTTPSVSKRKLNEEEASGTSKKKVADVTRLQFQTTTSKADGRKPFTAISKLSDFKFTK